MPVMLAEQWKDTAINGWWVSEKFDGVRAIWDGTDFVSRLDNKFPAPDWFKSLMPQGVKIDGELWAGRGTFQQAISIVKNAAKGDEWKYLTFMVFDVISMNGLDVTSLPFEQRQAHVEKLVNDIKKKSKDALRIHVKAVPHIICKDNAMLEKRLKDVEAIGGEGLMLRKPASTYVFSRSKSLLKVKSFHEEEAKVVGHEDGKGKYDGMLGALLCVTPDGRKFKVGSGLNDEDRDNPPKHGSMISYKYTELTDGNIPRFPVFRGIRIDLKWAAYCKTYKAPGSKDAVPLSSTLHSCMFDDGASGSSASAKKKLAASSSEDDDEEDSESGSVGHVGKKAKVECKYGLDCYRKNLEHHKEFAHPWLD
eukprot:GEMP01017181.1.p1 GENE.GEMP01017181.1~~GEMP01017181.1.p1  ORF type:complete len:364 (+),score=87.75 GEMP01017181.1:176-1267(+)